MSVKTFNDLGGQVHLMVSSLKPDTTFVWSAFNPSLAIGYTNRTFIILSSGNYTVNLENRYKIRQDFPKNEIWMAELDDDYKIINVRQLDWRGVSKELYGHPEIVRGLRNPKIYQDEIGFWYFSADIEEEDNPLRKVACLGIVPDQSRILGMEILDRTSSIEHSSWMPVHVEKAEFDFMCNPYQLYKENKIVNVSPLVEVPSGLEGASQLIHFADGCLIGIMKRQIGTETYNGNIVEVQDVTKIVYEHYFVLLDMKGQIFSISDPFSFLGSGIETCSGITLKDDTYLIGFGVNEQDAYMARISKDIVKSML